MVTASKACARESSVRRPCETDIAATPAPYTTTKPRANAASERALARRRSNRYAATMPKAPATATASGLVAAAIPIDKPDAHARVSKHNKESSTQNV